MIVVVGKTALPAFWLQIYEIIFISIILSKLFMLWGAVGWWLLGFRMFKAG